jgi:phosphatidylglycerol:prolipoprotein diacylglycerol transferase
VPELSPILAGLFPLPPLDLFGLKLHAFGFLVGTGIILGTVLAGRRARDFGASEQVVSQLALWAVIPGFIGAHFVHVLAYYPEEFLKRPLYLLEIWNGISSFGGFVGGTLGVWWYFRRNRGLPFLPYADALIYGFTFAWIFGRLGCTVAFDHPGFETDFLLAMDYPGDGKDVGPGLRHNLGFYEAIWSVVMAAFFFTQRHVTHFKGWFVAVFVLTYMPFRFGLDFLRAVDERYAGLTPGQWISFGLFGLAILLVARGSRRGDLLVPDGVLKPALLTAAERDELARRAPASSPTR